MYIRPEKVPAIPAGSPSRGRSLVCHRLPRAFGKNGDSLGRTRCLSPFFPKALRSVKPAYGVGTYPRSIFPAALLPAFQQFHFQFLVDRLAFRIGLRRLIRDCPAPALLSGLWLVAEGSRELRIRR